MERPSYKIDANHPGSDLASEVAAAFTASYLVFKDTGKLIQFASCNTIESMIYLHRIKSDNLLKIRQKIQNHLLWTALQLVENFPL